MTFRPPRWLTRLLRIGVVCLAAFLLYRSDAFDPKLLARLDLTAGRIIIILAALAVVALVGGLRWWLVLNGAGVRSGYWRLARLNCIGYFYNLILPGGMGGDLAKAIYAAREHQGSQALAGASVAIDRGIGLMVLILVALAAMAGLAVFVETELPLRDMTWVLVAILAVGLGGLYLAGWLLKRPFLGERRIKGFLLADLARLWPRGWTLFGVAVLSLVLHGIYILVMIILARSLGNETATLVWLALAPLAMIANQIPISPGGLGVGEFSLFTLLAYFTPPGDPNPGALIFIIFRLAYHLIGLAGAILLLHEPNRLTSEAVRSKGLTAV